MVWRFTDKNGNKLPNTRVSNCTVIGYPQNLEIGDNVFIHHFTVIDASHSLKIGEGCQIGSFVSIVTHSSHIALRLYGKNYTKQKNPIAYKTGKVSIGAYTFVGPNSIIMPNTSIGKGSLVSAFSYVQGEFPDFSIIAGNPAKIVGDTRKLDERYLNQNPELREYYNEWANKE